jgi:hypothetical protein
VATCISSSEEEFLSSAIIFTHYSNAVKSDHPATHNNVLVRTLCTDGLSTG